jgi:hypothetical protein
MKMNHWKIISIVLLMAFLVVIPAQSQEDLSVILETTPTAGQIGPDNTLARTSLKVVDANGQPIPQAYLKLHLDSPPGNPIISTDFPIVENTTLLEYEGTLPDGVLEFESIYPIRGQYSFHVEAGRDATSLSFKDTLSLSLGENTNEVINGIVFIGLLLGLGVVAGVIIGNGARAQRLVATGVVLTLLVSGLVISTSVAQAHGGSDVAQSEPFNESATDGDLTLTYAMNPGAGRVGTLNTLSFQATDSSGALAPETVFELKLWHIEDEKPVFTTRLYAPDGQTGFKFQFFDGAEHEVRVTASNARGSVDLTRIVEVEGIDPPLPVKIKTTIYLVLVSFVGVLIGLRLQIIRGKKSDFAPVGV